MKHLYLILFIYLFNSCANIIPPNGGPIDIQAPTLVNTYPNNFSNNFSGQEIEFVFDEKIIATNFNTSFFISPPLEKKADYNIKGNKLTLNLNKQLKDNATYYIYIGESISDLNEGNKIKDVSLLFSTGSELDTLYIEGYAKDIKTGLAIKECWLFLYPLKNKEDNNKTASYIAKTNEKGFFIFPNLNNEQYRITALEDLDNNLNYSLPNEKVGFLDALEVSHKKSYAINLFSQNDSLNTFVDLELDSVSQVGRLIVDSIPENYFLELFNDNGIVSRGELGEKFEMDSLLIGEYQLRLINDLNFNGVWDTGDLKNKIQAEEILFYPQTIKIRSNWDLELKWKTRL
jgi:hypothetical protein